MKKDRDLISIIGLENIQEVSEGDDIANLISEAAKKQGITIKNNDIVIITHKNSLKIRRKDNRSH